MCLQGFDRYLLSYMSPREENSDTTTQAGDEPKEDADQEDTGSEQAEAAEAESSDQAEQAWSVKPRPEAPPYR